MSLTLKTAPSGNLLTLSELYSALRLESPPPDKLEVEAIRDAVEAYLDGAQGILGRALLTQTWYYRADAFPCGEIVLPLAPVQSITMVRYNNASGTQINWVDATTSPDTAKWQVNLNGVGKARIKPNSDELIWPQTKDGLYNAVEVEFVAGYGAASAVPKSIKRAALMLAAHFYENREATTSMAANFGELPLGVRHLLAPYRVY